MRRKEVSQGQPGMAFFHMTSGYLDQLDIKNECLPGMPMNRALDVSPLFARFISMSCVSAKVSI